MNTDKGIFISGENIVPIRLLFPLGVDRLRNVLKIVWEIRGYYVELVEIQEGYGKTQAIETPWGLVAMLLKN